MYLGLYWATLGYKAGTQTETLTEAQMPAHTHNAVAGFYTYVGSGAENQLNPGSGSGVTYSDRAAVGGGRYGITTSKGGGAAHNNMPPIIVMNYEIIAG